jgi:hypothetical protein
MPTSFVTPTHAPWLRRSTQVRTQAKQAYTPSMIGSKYYYAVTQVDTQGVLNPVAHMFVQDIVYKAEPNIVAAIMKQLSLKAGLKEWGDQAFASARPEMKQLHLWNEFKPKHWRNLSKSRARRCWSVTYFSSISVMERSRGEPSLAETSSATPYPRRMLAHPPSPRMQYFCDASLTPRKGAMSQW